MAINSPAQCSHKGNQMSWPHQEDENLSQLKPCWGKTKKTSIDAQKTVLADMLKVNKIMYWMNDRLY